MGKKKVAVLAVASASGEIGGAERFYEGLSGALCEAGVDARLVLVVSDESCFEAIQESYLRFYNLDLTGFDGVISTKAPAYLVRHPNHIAYLQHTMRVYYDMFREEFPRADRERERQRRLIHQWDSEALRYPRTKKIFVIGYEVQRRLQEYNRLGSQVLYQALSFDPFRSGPYGDYFLVPGRLHRWKRVDLAIEAMRFVTSPLRLIIAGGGEDEGQFRRLAAGDERIQFVGRVSDAQLAEWYAGACGVLFVPVREDFGLVTLEAFASRKPVITCWDSGEPPRLVRDAISGFVCRPDPRHLAVRMDYLYRHRRVAALMGEAGARWLKRLSWRRVAECLLESLGFHQRPNKPGGGGLRGSGTQTQLDRFAEIP